MKIFIRKNYQRNYEPEESKLKELINNNMTPVRMPYKRHIDNPVMNRIAPDYHSKLFVRISPSYGYEIGFCRGSVNNYKIIVFLCKRIPSRHYGYMISYASFTDEIIINNLRKVFQNGRDRQVQGIISRDLLFIYRHTDSKGYNVNWRFPKNKQLIYQTLDKITLNYQLMKCIMHLSYKYHRSDCMDLWFEWIYLAMIAEFFPKRPYPNDVYPTATGKYVKALGLYQCLYNAKYNWNGSELNQNPMTS